MNKSKELKTTTDIVKYILRNYPNTRNDDNELYFRVCDIIGRQKGVDIHRLSMPMFFLHLHEYGFPTCETVGRARRKVKEIHPEFAGNSTVEAHRTMNEEVFKDYARQVNV